MMLCKHFMQLCHRQQDEGKRVSMWRACPRMTQVCMNWNTSQWPSRVASVITMSSVALTNTLEMPAKPPLAMLMQAWLTLDLLDEQAPLQQDGKLETSCSYFQYTY